MWIKKVTGGVQIRLLGFDFFLVRNLSARADNLIFDRNISNVYYPDRTEDLKLYETALFESEMVWTDNIYKQLRVLSFLQLVRWSATRNPSGCFLELGVWKGLSALMIAKTLRDKLSSNQILILVDSFEGGLSQKSSQDKNLVIEQSRADIEAEKRQFSSRKEQVARVLSGYDGIQLIEGWVPDVLVELDTQVFFSFIHFDMDLYEPTASGLRKLWKNLLPSGVIVFDDFNSTQFPGVTEAVREFVRNREDEINLFYEVPFGSAWLIKK